MLQKKKGFTLAEVLATLGIIGIVAVMTIPGVVADVRGHVFKTRQQAFANDIRAGMQNLLIADGKINKAAEVSATKDEDGEELTAGKTANQVFVQDYLTKALKIAKICNPSNNENKGIEDCGFSKATNTKDLIYQYPGASGMFSMIQKNSDLQNFNGGEDPMWAAQTANGISMLIAYNNTCTSQNNYPCLNIIYDVNGRGAPNIVGKDIGFLTVFNPKSPHVGAPVLYNNAPMADKSSLNDVVTHCNKYSKKGDISAPSEIEASSLAINGKLLNITSTNVIPASSTGKAICVYR